MDNVINLYTIEEAEKILYRKKQIKKNRKRKALIAGLKQKSFGLVVMTLGVVCGVTFGAWGYTLIVGLMGCGLLLSKKNLL